MLMLQNYAKFEKIIHRTDKEELRERKSYVKIMPTRKPEEKYVDIIIHVHIRYAFMKII